MELNTVEQNTAASNTLPPQNIYVMPDKFQPKEKKSSFSSFVVAIILLIIVLVAVGSYFAYDYFIKAKNKDVKETPVDNSAVVNFQEEEFLTLAPPTEEEIVEEVQEPATTTEPVKEEENKDVKEISLVPPVESPDTDNDGLTDIEENLIGTSHLDSDTDKDGFKDGDEIISGYNPLIPESSEKAKLENADFLRIAVTDFADDNFSIPVMKKWSFSTVKATKQAIITTETGEIIKISVKENADRISAIDWYLKLNPQVMPVQLKQIEYGNLSGLIAPDNLSVYFSDSLKTKIYSFEYIMDAGSQLRYPNIVKMMIKKFTLVKLAPNTNNSTNTSSEETLP